MEEITFESVAYDLAYYGADADLERAIIETILRLPQDVARFALDRCRFLSVGKASLGMAVAGRIASDWQNNVDNMWLLLLAETLPQEDIHSAIAHEIAHAWRGDDSGAAWQGGDPPSDADCETPTANLVRDWGFTGKGADAEYCRIEAPPL